MLLITKYRHFLFDIGLLKSNSLPVFTVVVGNLRLGGTGKTPFVHYLSTLFTDEMGAILLRGYRRKSSGFHAVDVSSNPEQVGDEAMLHVQKKPIHFTVYVGENRYEAGLQILKNKPSTRVILLDDGFQHRALKPTLSIVLTSFYAPFFSDFPFPLGHLREGRSALKRADILLITHCPEDLPREQKEYWTQKCRSYLYPSTPIFFSNTLYGVPYSLNHRKKDLLSSNVKIVLVAGLADPTSFFNSAREYFFVEATFFFPDHHIYKVEEIKKIVDAYPGVPVVITEKDAVKWKFLQLDTDLPIFVWPISIHIQNEDEFKLYILEKYRAFQG